MDCGTSMVKYILFIFNTLVSIIGILAIAYGVYILHSIGPIEINDRSGFPPHAIMPVVLIILGSIVLFIAFLGCCGAIRESVCMTMTYAVFLMALLIIQLIVVVLLWTKKDQFLDAMGNVIDNAWERDSRDKLVFDTIQRSFKCCGTNGATDYALIVKTPPPSCCEHENCVNPLNFYGGCRAKFQDFMSFSTGTSQYVALGLIVVELVGFVFACILANNVRNYKRRNAF